jgi:hypothetical protein
MKRRGQKGNALAALLVAVVTCGALSASVIVSTIGRQREANTELARERAFGLAEAGVDWALVQIRIRNGVVPTTSPATTVVDGAGTYTLRYAQGDVNLLDDNGDAVVDDAGEHSYAEVRATGESAGLRRSIAVLLRKAVETPSFDASVQINVEAPVIDLNGNAFTISGEEHTIAGAVDSSRPAKFGITSPAATSALTSQITSAQADNVTGAGGLPSVGTSPPMDLAHIMQQASLAATVALAPGTHSNINYGTATEEGVAVVYCNGDLRLAGTSSGAGVLAVDGDLEISGGFTWTGIILVRGRTSFTGGGSTKRLIGAMGVGEEVTNHTGSTSVGVSGTVDLFYSSDAVALAASGSR